jgi:hypothetical protein
MTSVTDLSTFRAEKQAETAQKFLQMYRGNERGHGWGDPKGAFYDQTKSKWMFKPGFIGWKWGPTTVEHWEAHLAGEIMLGVGPLLDDGTVWWGCIDVDKVGEFTHYDFDLLNLVKRAKTVCSSFDAIRSKSGGLHLFLHFDKPTDAGKVQDGLKMFSARIGIAGNEIFPKQRKLLAEEGDAPSWLFMPYFGSKRSK